MEPQQQATRQEPQAITTQPIDELSDLLVNSYKGDSEKLKLDLTTLTTAPTPTNNLPVDPNRVKVLEAVNISKEYKLGNNKVAAVRNVTLTVYDQEVLAITGPSGSGKSTLMNLLGGLDQPAQGEIKVNGIALGGMKDKELSTYRAKNIGFVFQFFYLQPFLNIKQNVQLPGMFAGDDKSTREARAMEALEAVGLADKALSKPNQLSGGQIQRVAIARAIFNKPKIILADEPTGNLDQTNAAAITQLFLSMRNLHQAAIVMVTHDQKIAALADREIRILDGGVVR